tara:strand:- start:88 stop:513 length:426 start_codon:yes stop_codon:yes gene_type:complete
MRITKIKIKQMIIEEMKKMSEARKLGGYSNLPPDAKVELIDFINSNFSANKGPSEWLDAIQRAIEVEPRSVGYKPTGVEIKGDSLFLVYRLNQKRSFRLMKKFLDFRARPPTSKMSIPSGLKYVETIPTEGKPFYTLEIKK